MTNKELQSQIDKATKLLEEARNFYDTSRYEESERCAREVITSLEAHSERDDVAEERDTSSQKFAIIGLLAHAYNRLNAISLRRADYQNAIQQAETAIAFCVRIENRKRYSTLLGSIGTAHMSLTDYPKALEYYGKALAMAEELGYEEGVAALLSNIGNVHLNLFDYPKALECYDKALMIDEELGNKQGVAGILGNIGIVHGNLSEHAKALEYFEKSRSICEELGNRTGVAASLGNIGKVQIDISDYPKALEYIGKALLIDEELGNKSGVAIHLGNIGNVHGHLTDYPKALEYYGKALLIDEELGIKEGVATHLGNIGEAHRNLADYPKAFEYYSKALTIDEELGNKAGAARHLGNIGATYSTIKFEGFDAAKAEEYLLKALALSAEIGAKSLLVEFHKTLSELYELEERWEEFAVHFKKHIALEKEINIEETRKQESIREQRKAVEIAKAAADAKMSATSTLLYKVLPESIANRLVKGERIADYFPAVSILFSDIVGFTPIAARMPAKAVLAFLNYVFGEIDRMVELTGCEKIKTIGDGYLAVAGAPLACEDHAERIARLALEMSRDIILPEDIRKTLPKNSMFSIRIGIHTGPCFGGIVGENRFVYDIYSDAVNTAARMESHGEPGKINVSDEFCFHLQNRMDMTGDDLGGVTFQERDEIEIKGKGKMRTYFLERA